MIAFGIAILIHIFVKTYKKFVFSQRSESIRRGSVLIMNGSRLLPLREASYRPLAQSLTPNLTRDVRLMDMSKEKSGSNDAFERSNSFVRADLLCPDTESLIRSDNTFIMSERRCSLVFKHNDERPMI